MRLFIDTSFISSQVNCHRDVINCLLDYGANVNKLNDEGLSVLAACHVLFYTKHTWKDNIAESIPLENLFNSIQEGPQKGVYTHRNSRRKISHLEGPLSDMGQVLDENVETKKNNAHNKLLSAQPVNALDVKISELDMNGPGSELDTRLPVEYAVQSPADKTVDDSYLESDETLKTNGLSKTTTAHVGQTNGHDLALWSSLGKRKPTTEADFVPTDFTKLGRPGLRADVTLFSVLSAVGSTRDVSDSEDAQSENSVEQNKQMLLAMQRSVRRPGEPFHSQEWSSSNFPCSLTSNTKHRIWETWLFIAYAD